MIYLFGLLITSLVFCAFVLLLPVLKILSTAEKTWVAGLFLIGIFACYAFLGSPKQMIQYYSKEGEHYRSTQIKMRPLFSQVKKQQARLRLRLIENPQDSVAKALLLELLGVEALYQEDHKLALNFWQTALEILPNLPETENIRLRMLGLKQHVGNL